MVTALLLLLFHYTSLFACGVNGNIGMPHTFYDWAV
jgi:hypothetical protein